MQRAPESRHVKALLEAALGMNGWLVIVPSPKWFRAYAAHVGA